MTMTKEAKHDLIATETTEVCIRVYVKNGNAADVAAALLKLAQEQEGFVCDVGGYVEPAESHEIEEIVERLPDEVYDRIK